MSLSSIWVLFLIGCLAGMLAMLSVAALMIGAFVKVPGGNAVRYWALGSSLILIGMVYLLWREEGAPFLNAMLACGLFMAGHVLQWHGLQIFYFKIPHHNVWWIAGVYWLAFGLLTLSGATFAERMAFISLVPLVVWPLCLREVLDADHRPYKFATFLAVIGLMTMMVGASIELMLGVFPGELAATLEQSGANFMVEAVVPILGSLMYLAALILLYFERAAAQTNYAATHDELTGLLNRRALIAGGEQEIERARRNRHSLVVAFADIDFFKKINDEFGHDAGDLVLKEVAQVLHRTCRMVDLVGRYGGEEFCLVFPGDHHGGAEVAGKRIVEAVRNHHFPGLPQVTISVGLAVLPVGDLSHTWHSLVQQADIELYKAKQNGRNDYSIYGKQFKKTPRGRSPGRELELPLERRHFFFLTRS